jgi:hypothetical protein
VGALPGTGKMWVNLWYKICANMQIITLHNINMHNGAWAKNEALYGFAVQYKKIRNIKFYSHSVNQVVY